MFCVNLSDGDRMYFSEGTTPEHAAAYGHYTSNGMSSWFFDLIRSNPNWVETVSWEYGKYTVCVSGSDWYAPTYDISETN